MKKIASIFAALVLVGCAGTGGMQESEPMDLDSTIKAAEAAIKEAKSAGGEWRDSGKFLKKAKEAAKKGDEGSAMKLAKKALKQGKLGKMQAMDQKNAGPWLF